MNLDSLVGYLGCMEALLKATVDHKINKFALPEYKDTQRYSEKILAVTEMLNAEIFIKAACSKNLAPLLFWMIETHISIYKYQFPSG